ncbi:hypothetical protein FACS1894191_2970 [Clostridia bacterium]|nr:hypothetical protein FACS1894191_2970 [Clostridia bacterium]
MGVIWTDEALANIADIYAYIAKDSPYQAGRFTDALMDSVEMQLDVSVLVGHELPEGNNPDLRRIIYHNYRIIYHIQGERIYIKHVEHGAKLLTKSQIEEILDR